MCVCVCGVCLLNLNLLLLSKGRWHHGYVGLPVITVALCTHILVCVCDTSDNLLNWVNFIRKCLLRSAK